MLLGFIEYGDPSPLIEILPDIMRGFQIDVVVNMISSYLDISVIRIWNTTNSTRFVFSENCYN